MSDPEASLIRRCAEGDQHAFQALVHRTQRPVWSLIRSLATDEGSAEDALQETFLSVWRSAASFRGEGSGRAWLFTVARRQAIRTWRRRVGEPTQAVPLHELGALAGWGQNPEQLMSMVDDKRLVSTALSSLSPTDREVIVLCDLEGMTGPEAGSVLGISPNAVRVRLHRARLRLMGQLREETDVTSEV